MRFSVFFIICIAILYLSGDPDSGGKEVLPNLISPEITWLKSGFTTSEFQHKSLHPKYPE